MIVPEPVTASRSAKGSRRIGPTVSSLEVVAGTSATERWLIQNRRAIARLMWNYTHADWLGSYSLDKLVGLYHEMMVTPHVTVSQLVYLVLPSLPAMVVTLLLICIPLKDPSLGWRANWAFFLREFIGSWSALLNVVHAAFLIAVLIGFVVSIGVFPIPFAPMIVMPIYAIFCWATRIYVARKVLWNSEEPEKALAFRTKLWKFIDLMGFMVQMITAYAALATVFSRVPSRYQVLMVMTIQGFKIFVRNTLWRKAQLYAQGDDMAPILVATSTQFFHSLFISTCFQTSKSVLTLLLMVGWNILQDGLSIRSISRLTTRVVRLRRKSITQSNTTQAQFQALIRLSTQDSSLGSVAVAIKSMYPPYRALATQIRTQARQTNDQTPTVAEKTWIDKQAQLFHCREVLLLRLYTETIAPIFYLVFVSTLQHLPNRVHMSYLGHADLSILIHRITLQVLTRFILLVVFLRGLNRTSFPSGLQQLLFVLRHQRVPFQAGCVNVALFVFAFSVQHYGNDISFRFAWLKHTNSTSQ